MNKMFIGYWIMMILTFIIMVGILVFVGFPIKINELKQKRLNIARILNIIFPGLGYVIIGNWIRGIILCLIWIIFGVILIITNIYHMIIGTETSSDFWETMLVPLIIWISGLIGLSGLRREK